MLKTHACARVVCKAYTLAVWKRASTHTRASKSALGRACYYSRAGKKTAVSFRYLQLHFLWLKGPKKTPTNVTCYNYTSTTSINVTWLPFDDLYILERMLGYRVSYRAVRIGDENVEKGEAPTYNLTVRKTTLTVVIEGLESYTRYQINVSGFSRRGMGQVQSPKEVWERKGILWLFLSAAPGVIPWHFLIVIVSVDFEKD